MKIVLIFSPFIAPSYLPLGIAQLKSYLEAQLPFVKVYNLDLNNRFFNDLTKKEFLSCCKNLCLICKKKDRHKKYRIPAFDYSKIYKISIDCLRDEKTKEFYDFGKYKYLIKVTLSFFRRWEYCIDTFAKDIIRNERPVPTILKKLFQEDINRICGIKPNFVGFSIFSEAQLAYSAILAKVIKEKFYVPIMFGGAFMSYIDISTFLRIFDFVDFAVTKEGEIAMVEFAKNFKYKNFNNVPGLIYRKGSKIIQNSEKFIENLDTLPPPDFSNFNLNQYLFPTPVFPIIFSRGCFWKKCTFCTYYKKYPISYKTKSLEKFIEEIKYYNSQGVKYFFIDDDVITAARLDLISGALIENKIKIFFGAIVRPEREFSPKVLKNIYAAGGRVLIWGVESSCQRILDLMKKGTKVKYIKSVLRNSHRLGFHNHLFMIIGFPTQTEEEIYHDMNFLQKNQLFINSFYLHKFSLEKGSYIFRNLRNFKIKNFKAQVIYTRRKNREVLYSNKFSFQYDPKLNWKRITKRAFELLKERNYSDDFSSYEHGHMLIHASQRRK